MGSWGRVFGSNEGAVEPAALLEYLQADGQAWTGQFSGDDQGWFHADLLVDGEDVPLELDCFLAAEEGIRDELNTWAAWLETQDSPHSADLMRHLIQARQVFTLFQPAGPDADLDRVCHNICQFLASRTEGVYQLDGQGFFSAAGELLVPETE